MPELDTDLTDSMVINYIQDIETEFDLDTTDQAIFVIRESLKRIEGKDNERT